MRNSIRRVFLRTATTLGITLLTGTAVPAFAQPYPSRPVRIVVPYPAGGGVDVMVRIVAAKMGERLGQPVVVENRPGANANLGPDHVAKSPADGYTLLASATYLVVNPLLEQQLTWRSGELQPVARLTTTPNLFVVRTVSPFRTLSDFVTQARVHAGLPVGTSGPGSPQSMAMELLRVQERLELTLIPYRGAPPIMTDLLNGTLAISVLPLGAIMAIIQGGQFRGLAVTSEDRSPLVPEVPSIAEAGYPDLVIVSWYGLHAPAGTPSAVIQSIARAAKDATADQEVRDGAAKAGGETAFLDTKEFAAFLAEDLRRWKRNVAVLAAR